MELAEAADQRRMAKSSNEQDQELKPAMRDLILRFDAKDRRAADKKSKAGANQKRRRGDKPVGAP